MLAALLSIVPNIVGGISDHFEHKRKLKEIDLEGQIATKQAITQSNVQLAQAGQAHEIKWSETMAAASLTSWKDEYWTIVLSIPAIMAFIPGLVGYVTDGFGALAATPAWYQGLLAMAIAAAFGVSMKKKFQGMEK